jgi:hypothetical protein
MWPRNLRPACPVVDIVGHDASVSELEGDHKSGLRKPPVRVRQPAEKRKAAALQQKLTCRQARWRHDAVGPVAEVSTQEQCIALHPGSNPGRASKGEL